MRFIFAATSEAAIGRALRRRGLLLRLLVSIARISLKGVRAMVRVWRAGTLISVLFIRTG